MKRSAVCGAMVACLATLGGMTVGAQDALPGTTPAAEAPPRLVLPGVVSGQDEPEAELAARPRRVAPATPYAPGTRPSGGVSGSPRTAPAPAAPGRSTTPLSIDPPAPPRPSSPGGTAPFDDRQLTPSQEALRTKVRRVLAMYTAWPWNTRDHNPWEIMHAYVAYGVHTEIRRGGPQGPAVNAIAWACGNGSCHGQDMLFVERDRITARKGVGVQGHYGQFLAILAQSRVRPDYPLLAEGREFTVADLIETEQRGCRTGMELTFKLISLAHYLDLDETWQNDEGEIWSIPRLIGEEIKSPIRGAACGGTHRLMGLSYAVQKRRARGQPVDGEYLRAERYIEEFHRYTFGLQNPDGSFSTSWFVKRENRPDMDRKLQTTGHILEWLVFSLRPENLSDPRVVKAVDFIATILLENPRRSWEIGPLGHGLHALRIYDERQFGTPIEMHPIEAYRGRPETPPADAAPITGSGGPRAPAAPAAPAPPATTKSPTATVAPAPPKAAPLTVVPAAPKLPSATVPAQPQAAPAPAPTVKIAPPDRSPAPTAADTPAADAPAAERPASAAAVEWTGEKLRLGQPRRAAASASGSAVGTPEKPAPPAAAPAAPPADQPPLLLIVPDEK